MSRAASSLDHEGESEEEILEPSLPIIDAHHHLMDRPSSRYMFDDILRDTSSGHNVIGTVYIESRSMMRATGPEQFRPVGETEFANGVAALSASGQYGGVEVCAGIVAFADLSMGDAVEAVVEAHEARAGERFKGIRHGTYWDAEEGVYRYVSMRPPSGLLTDRQYRRGLGVLERRGASYDAVLFFHQLPELSEVAREFPGLTVVLNHMGFPLGLGKYSTGKEDVFRIWREHMRSLSACENVFVKLGGGGMPLWGFGFESRADEVNSEELAEAWRPYVEVCVDLFGPSRCMFESNFPPDRVSCSYRALWNAFKRIATGFNGVERAALFSGSAAEAYRLAVAD